MYKRAKLYISNRSLICGIPQTLSLFYLSLRVITHTQPLNALEGVICEVKLVAKANIQPFDTLEVCKHCTSQLRAAPQAQAMNALEVGEGGICDGGLVAIIHPQRVDAFEMYKGGIRNGVLVAIPYSQSVDPLKVHKGCICDGDLIATTHV